MKLSNQSFRIIKKDNKKGIIKKGKDNKKLGSCIRIMKPYFEVVGRCETSERVFTQAR